MKAIIRATASACFISGLVLASTAQAQTPSPQKVFRLTMDYAAKVEEAATPVNAKAAQAAEALAKTNAATDATVGSPLRYDADGYYFSFVQTSAYEHTKTNERMGVRSPRSYEALRCRLGASLESSGVPVADGGTWRVCPDALGRYRVTL